MRAENANHPGGRCRPRPSGTVWQRGGNLTADSP